MLLDDTQPKRPSSFVTPPNMIDDEEEGGPGCLVWTIIGLFCLGLALATVFLASFAGWSEGLRIGQGNATATVNADIVVQCERIPQDIANASMGLVQARFDSLAQFTPVVPCIATYAPSATALYLQSVATEAPTSTPSPTLTLTPEVVTTVTEEAVPASSTPASSSSGFDLGALLAEAQQALTAGTNRIAIETLDAISAVDPQYQKGTVDQLLYQGLTTEARRLYRTGTSLAEAVLLTNRAEQYGDVGELNYERYIAEIYLQAQIYLDTNYPKAIQQLSLIVYTQNLPNYLGSSSLLNQQFVKYGDLLVASADYCNAQRQYESALSLFASGEVRGKADDATLKCQQGVPIVGTVDPNATPAPTPEGGAGDGVSPIGVRP